ncbi:carbohydrate binding domain-containing protein [Candidatus Poribacteria bacterium]
MKLKSAVLVSIFLLTGICMVYAADDEIVNLFDNPGFEEGKGRDLQAIPGWKMYLQNGGTGLLSIDTEEAIEGDQCVMIEVTGVPAGGTWNVRFDHDRRFPVEDRVTYTMSFWMKGDMGPVTISPSRAEQNEAGEWGNLASKVINPTPEWEEYYLTFQSSEDRLVMWQLLISNPKQIYWVDYARCYEGEYVEGEIKPVLRAVSPSGKLATQWGDLKSD